MFEATSISKSKETKEEKEQKVVKFPKVPKNQCLYCSKQLTNDLIVASCGPNNSAIVFEYDGFKIHKTLNNDTFEVIYSMAEIEGFLFTGHSKGLIMVWDYTLGERVIKHEGLMKEPVTSIVQMKGPLILVSLMNGDLELLKVDGDTCTLEFLN